MTAKIIDGKKIASELKAEIALQVAKIKKQYNITPSLAVILVGSDPASEIYVGNKERAAHLVGMNSIQYKLTNDTSEEELLAKIHELNQDSTIHAILVQLPLPKTINSKNIIQAIDGNKDVDGFNIVNVGKLAIGDIYGDDGAVVPCTPLACMHLIKSVLGNNLAGLKALVIGASNIVGRPLAQLLMIEKCTVTVANRDTRNLKSHCLNADIIICATGVVGLLKKDMVQKQTIIIDVGINRINIGGDKSILVGDVDFEEVKTAVAAITPVPGGVGPMTIAYLLKNTLNLCLRAIKKGNLGIKN